ncbi:endonuclease-reverse transcriptase domain-containing protein [Phthorimaea operculella]|nr:endonuclease-reverse transcriptase domain-containing protein [Phthorimaea operculella]
MIEIYLTGWEGGGVSILIHRSIKSECRRLLHSNSGLELIHIRIFYCNEIENIICVYCPSEVSTTDRDWDTLFSSFSRKTLILGDFNGHHVSWSYKTDTRGKQLFDSIIESNFVVMNDGSPTRFQLVQGILRQSSPDLSLVSADVASFFNWSVTNETLGSDHFILKIRAELTLDVCVEKKRNFKKADWYKYSTYLKDSFSEIDFTINDIQKSYNIFVKNINDAADLFIPFIKYCQFPDNNFKPRPYWTPDLSRSVALRRLALANFRG